MNCHRKDFLSPFLTNNIIIQEVMDLLRSWKLRVYWSFNFFLQRICNNFIAEFNALIANINRGACNELFYFSMPFATERAF
jgi:hypothetical protein